MGEAWREQVQWVRLFAEGVAIVTSILLAFGIQAWWDDRMESREEDRVLESLRNELATNQSLLRESLAFQSGIQAAVLALLSEAAMEVPRAEPDSIDRLLAKASWFNASATFEMSASDAIIQGGRLSLIADEGLRQRITRWNRRVAFVTRLEEQDGVIQTDVWMPYLRQHANVPQYNNSTTETPAGEPGHNLVVPLGPERTDHRQLLRDSEFLNVLQHRLWAQDDITNAYRELEPELIDLTHQIAEALER